MRRFGKLLGRVLLALALILAAIFTFGPREPLGLTPQFDATRLTSDLDAYLMARESAFRDITPGTKKRIIWAGAPGEKTAVSIVYLHGFSATSEEIRPVPDRVAATLGANLYFVRYAGHGRGAAALAEPTVQDWVNDTAEALAIGAQIGERVIVIANSTGGTLAAVAATDPDLAPKIGGIVFTSPNFGLNSMFADILTWPWARLWGPKIAGPEQTITAVSPDHAKYWTLSYPTEAIFPMAALARAARGLDYGHVSIPAIFLYSEEDRVVSPRATKKVAANWGGPMTIEARVLGPQDDAYRHILAGDILSTSQTDAMVLRICDWVRALK